MRSMPANGCASFEREVGADDEPDKVPAARAAALPHAGQLRAQEGPAVKLPVQWAP